MRISHILFLALGLGVILSCHSTLFAQAENPSKSHESKMSSKGLGHYNQLQHSHGHHSHGHHSHGHHSN